MKKQAINWPHSSLYLGVDPIKFQMVEQLNNLFLMKINIEFSCHLAKRGGLMQPPTQWWETLPMLKFSSQESSRSGFYWGFRVHLSSVWFCCVDVGFTFFPDLAKKDSMLLCIPFVWQYLSSIVNSHVCNIVTVYCSTLVSWGRRICGCSVGVLITVSKCIKSDDL